MSSVAPHVETITVTRVKRGIVEVSFRLCDFEDGHGYSRRVKGDFDLRTHDDRKEAARVAERQMQMDLVTYMADVQ